MVRHQARRLIILPHLGIAGLQSSGVPQLGEQAAHHIFRVARLGAGEEILLGDGAGNLRPARLTSARKGQARWSGPLWHVARPAPEVLLIFALIGHKDLSLAITSAIEAGVDRIALVATARSGHQLPADDAALWPRLERLGQEAASQSLRAYLPSFEAARSLTEAAGSLGNFAYADTCAPSKQILGKLWQGKVGGPMPTGPLAVAVGPEGGWSDAERAELAAMGGVPISLGPNILRSRTAAAIAVHDLVTLRSTLR